MDDIKSAMGSVHLTLSKVVEARGKRREGSQERSWRKNRELDWPMRNNANVANNGASYV